MIIPNIWETKKCSKPPTRYVWSLHAHCVNLCHVVYPRNQPYPKYPKVPAWPEMLGEYHPQMVGIWRWLYQIIYPLVITSSIIFYPHLLRLARLALSPLQENHWRSNIRLGPDESPVDEMTYCICKSTHFNLNGKQGAVASATLSNNKMSFFEWSP